MPDERPLSTGEVARLLHVTSVAVLGWIRTGKLKAYRVPGGRHRIPLDEFRRFLADNQIPLSMPSSSSSPRVLVVDDEASVREAFESVLRVKGCEVTLASNGRQALQTLRENHFDLIFLDIILPGMRGASLIRAIKRRDPEAVVIIITGFPHHEETLAALQLGPAMLLAKPIKLADIDEVFKVVFKKERKSA